MVSRCSPLERRYIGREAGTGSGLAGAPALVGCHLSSTNWSRTTRRRQHRPQKSSGICSRFSGARLLERLLQIAPGGGARVLQMVVGAWAPSGPKAGGVRSGAGRPMAAANEPPTLRRTGSQNYFRTCNLHKRCVTENKYCSNTKRRR